MKVEGGLSGNAQVLLAENWKHPLRVDEASRRGTNINFRFRSRLVTLISFCNFRVGNFSIPMVKTFLDKFKDIMYGRLWHMAGI